MFDRVQAFFNDLKSVKTEEELAAAIGEIVRDLGFKYFALIHHIDLRRSSAAMRIHNYPGGWAEWFEEQSLGVTDPVHRATNVAFKGFAWSELPDLIALTRADQRILKLARSEGIGDGYTIPAHVPGEVHGSCSFACAVGVTFTEEKLSLLQLVGTWAFEAARRMRRKRFASAPVRLTDRQREVVLLVASGGSDKEIGRILGISEETVADHLRIIGRRYGVNRRGLVAVNALFDGTIGFQDVLKRRE